MLAFNERRKPEYPGKTSHGRIENQQMQSTYDSECGNRIPGHIGGRQVPSPLGQPYHHYTNPTTTTPTWPSHKMSNTERSGNREIQEISETIHVTLNSWV